jgi:hypothetical protein
VVLLLWDMMLSRGAHGEVTRGVDRSTPQRESRSIGLVLPPLVPEKGSVKKHVDNAMLSQSRRRRGDGAGPMDWRRTVGIDEVKAVDAARTWGGWNHRQVGGQMDGMSRSQTRFLGEGWLRFGDFGTTCCIVVVCSCSRLRASTPSP